ncbi:MAG: 1-deoxy-D-xylulose-5-phosphate reductoisomerase [Candidatus Dormibacter sp.]|uniref:1-deoxy-D-xylulose-5-phosphate reductoisomerase n=1 Tax=Candidatus Dormibacter sp. TaxID=2973982 RepID=UPI000DAF496B|nr:MAG: 1-deoxy-D-xylulose-5-phosphate reductoisomerase [Candidatus Dormibacteraeota bacterium]
MTGRVQRIAILGATGSVGSQALQVIDRYPDRFQLLGLVCGRRPAPRPAEVIIAGGEPDFDARLEALVTDSRCDIVLVAIPGAVSLRPTLAALAAGKTVAIASKEVLVMAGQAVMAAVGRPDQLRPVDSEHSALWQCLWGESPASVSRLLLTASGGPFWSRPELELEQVTVAEALKHPRWSMGPKVTVDSATLMNKGLELIEAHHLFQVGLAGIDVVIHPQSVVHSLVEFVDGSLKAQLGNPDMRLPIGLALAYPERLPGVVEPTRLDSLESLAFEALDSQRFPAVELCREAARRARGYPAVLNASNEEAVAAFLAGRIAFTGILAAVESALAAWPGGGGEDLAAVLAADTFARNHFRERLVKVST